MLKRILVCFVIIGAVVTPVLAQLKESAYSPAISRMEREWFNREFRDESDENRLSRLEEKVFGTIHDIDFQSRYFQLRKAFDAKKTMQAKHKPNYLYGTPTSIPMNVDDLLGY